MAKELYFEDVAVGSEIPSLLKQPTTCQLVMWAGASGDFNPIHYDKDFARSQGLSGVIVPGQLVTSFLVQLVTDWLGGPGGLRKLSCSYRGMSYPGEAVTARGNVNKKYEESGDHLVECRLWAENPQGEKTVTATAVVSLPSRG